MRIAVGKHHPGPCRFVFVSPAMANNMQLHEEISEEEFPEICLMARNFYSAVAEPYEKEAYGPTEHRTVLIKVVYT